MNFRYIASVLVLGFSQSVVAQNQAPEAAKPANVKVHPVFAEGLYIEGPTVFTYVDEQRQRRLTCDLYKPAEHEEKLPIVVMFFGGGWQNGRPGLFAALAQRLAHQGYVCVVPNYRLSGEAKFPAAVHDCKAAVRWIRKHAKRFGADPDRIAVTGGSAGGHLAGFVAATNGLEEFEGDGDHQNVSSEVQAAMVMCGAMDFGEAGIMERIQKATETNRSNAIVAWLGETPEKNPELYIHASPVTHVSKSMPPTLFIDGEFDRPRVRYSTIWERMDELEIPNEFVIMPKGPHPFWVFEEWFEPTVEAMDGFLKRHFK